MSRDSAMKELRETQIRLAGLEDIDVKQLKSTVKTLQRQVSIRSHHCYYFTTRQSVGVG